MVEADQNTKTSYGTDQRRYVVGLLRYEGALGRLTEVTAQGVPPVPARLPQFSSGPSGANSSDRDDTDRVRKIPRLAALTAREHQVCSRIREGLSNKQIATRLGIAIHTVKSHVHNILEKLGLDSRVQVAVLTYESRPDADRSPFPMITAQ